MRLKELRIGQGISQLKLALDLNMNQNTISRYENTERQADYETLVKFADYFDVSLDYIFGRTDNPHGTHYEGKVKIERAYPEMDKFIEMCFDPGSPMNEKLKETLKQMLKEGAE